MKFLIQEVKDFNECSYNGIPKIIHLIWKGEKKPQYLIEQIQSWQKYLDKDWRIMFWGDKELENLKDTSDLFGKLIFEVAEHMPEIESYVDIIRLYILYQFGGYYFDADFQVFRDIEPMTHIDSNLIISNSTTAYYPYVDNAFLACTKKNSFMEYCLNSLMKKYKDGGMVFLRFLPHQHLHQLLLRYPWIQDVHQIVDVARLLLWSMCLAQAFVAEWLVALLFPEVSVHHLPKTVRTLNSHQPLNAHQSAEQVGQCVHIVHPNDSVRAVATAEQVDERLQLRILANPPESQQRLVKHREPLVGHACVAYIIPEGFSHLLASMTLSPTR